MKLRREMELYGLVWDESKHKPSLKSAPTWGSGIGVLIHDDLRARAYDFGPLSHWILDEQMPDGKWEHRAGGDVNAYAAGQVAATEAMVEILDRRAAAAAEALKTPAVMNPRAGTHNATNTADVMWAALENTDCTSPKKP